MVTNENLTVEFLKRELAAAQARIAVLDTQIDDKDKRIKILQSKVEFLEKRDSEYLTKKYFDDSNGREKSQSFGQTFHTSTHKSCDSVCSHHYCCSHTQHMQYPPCNPGQSGSTNDHFLTQLKDEFSSIRSILVNTNELIKCLSITDQKITHKEPVGTPDNLEKVVTDDSDVHIISQEDEANLSFASVDSTINEIPMNLN